MMKGCIDYLTGPSEGAQRLRQKFVFKIVPMLNPDGVIVGNYRTGLAGMHLFSMQACRGGMITQRAGLAHTYFITSAPHFLSPPPLFFFGCMREYTHIRHGSQSQVEVS